MPSIPMRYQLSLFWAIRLMTSTCYRMVYPFLAIFSRSLGVDIQTLSIAITASLFISCFGPFLAPIADRRGRKVSMLLGIGLFIIGTGLVTIFPTYPAFFACLLLTALSENLFLPAMQAYIGDHIPFERRGFVLSMIEISWALAFIVFVPLFGLLIDHSSWQAPYGVLAGFGGITFIGLLFLVPDDHPQVKFSSEHVLSGIKKVLTSNQALLGLGLVLIISGANQIIDLMFGVWLGDTFNLQIASLGIASTVIGFSELIGEGLAATIVDRFGKKQSITVGVILHIVAGLALPFAGSSLVGALIGLFFFYLTFEFSVMCILPLLTEVLPEARATTMACMVTAFALGRSMGAAAAPMLYTYGFAVCALVSAIATIPALLALAKIKEPGGAKILVSEIGE